MKIPEGFAILKGLKVVLCVFAKKVDTRFAWPQCQQDGVSVVARMMSRRSVDVPVYASDFKILQHPSCSTDWLDFPFTE